MPTDEEILEWLRKIKEHCKSCKLCDGCKFQLTDKNSKNDCQFKRLAFYLWRNTPYFWEMEEIERIIKL